MANESIPHHRKNGVYYTPSLLARILAEPLITDSNLSIFDPAYGNGALLLSAEQVLKEKHRSRKRSNLFGCDLSPLTDKTKHLPEANLIERDFFDYEMARKYDIVLMNPPYVRHHYLEREKIDHYQRVVKTIFPLKRTADLWSYFIVKATAHLKANGSIGAILPWSFLHADYSTDLRKWLSDRFQEIKVLVLGSGLFDDAEERIILAWLRGYGDANKKLSIGIANNPNDIVNYHSISKEYFSRNRVNIAFSNDAAEIIQIYKTIYRFQNLGDYADILIGVVTGANDFFVKNENDFGLSCFKRMTPIFTSSDQLKGFSINGNMPHSRLILITKSNEKSLADYIKYGESKQYHLRAHSLLRKPWYQVKVGRVPDAFFPYRVSLLPYLVLNNKKIQCTNSIHRLYFKNITPTEKKWIQISMLSIPGQLSLEANARVYGSGVLKVEPNSLKKSICYLSKDKSIACVYNQASKLLQINKRREAMDIATKFIEKSLGINRQLSIQAEAVYNELLTNRKKK